MSEKKKELDHLKDWENMMYFAIELIKESKQYKGTGIMGERIMILHLDHANELLMKSFLLEKGYVISYLDRKEAEKGIKKEEILNKDKTIDYYDCLNLVCQEINNDETKFSREKQDKILNFHRLRNEIQHRAINIPQDKKEEIRLFYPYFKELYTLMFPKFADVFPEVF